jgi:hypothetical protein
LGDFDGGEDVQPDHHQQARQIVGEGGVVTEERVAQAVGGIGHPADGEDAGPQVGGHLVDALEEEGAISSAARVNDARPPEGHRCRQGDSQEQHQGEDVGAPVEIHRKLVMTYHKGHKV